MPKPSPSAILLTGNTTFKLLNFRKGLISALIRDGHRVTLLAPPDDYLRDSHKLGCQHVPLKMDRNGMSVFSELALQLAIIRRLREIRPDAVFGYTIKNNIYGGLACRLLGIPFVPNVTGLGPAFQRRGLLNFLARHLYQAAFRDARVVMFQNDHDLAVFVKAGLCHSSKARLLPGSGVDLDWFAERPLPAANDGEFRFLLLSRMLWEKGVGEFVEVARELRTRHPSTRFQLLGSLDPDSRSSIPRDQIDAWAAEGVVEYLGNTRDVRPFIEAADCVVLPSTYREGTPRALLEACAMGRPIITTNMPGCRDVVDHGVNGWLIAPNDVVGLTAACARMVETPLDQRMKMGRCSRKIAEKRFDERTVIDAYRQIIVELQKNSIQ